MIWKFSFLNYVTYYQLTLIITIIFGIRMLMNLVPQNCILKMSNFILCIFSHNKVIFNFIYLYIYICIQLYVCLTLCTSLDCSLPGSSVHGFSRQKYWSGLPFPSPEDLPDSGTEPGFPALQADSPPSEPPGKSPRMSTNKNNPQDNECWLGCGKTRLLVACSLLVGI